MSSKKSGQMLSSDKLLALFEEKGALLTGHFRLSSGLHSDKYLQCALILQYPDIAGRIGSALAERFADDKPECVVGPAIGGIVVAQEVARALGVRALFMERESGTMTLRRGFSIKRGERVLVVEDITTTGGSVKEVVDALHRLGAVIIGVGAIIDRSGGAVTFDVPFRPLARLKVGSYMERECPLCKRGDPIYKPGSRAS